ncbi:MAG TPA: hypothetical protein VHA73_14400 [Acidimicrobiales bacterium]|jgi:hypothetical protein|nr:hypothetical protein [Acidimicrobiales bacterium]
MGKHADYLRGTASTMRRVANEGAKNFISAEEAIGATEQAEARQDAAERSDLVAKFPQLDRH